MSSLISQDALKTDRTTEASEQFPVLHKRHQSRDQKPKYKSSHKNSQFGDLALLKIKRKSMVPTFDGHAPIKLDNSSNCHYIKNKVNNLPSINKQNEIFKNLIQKSHQMQQIKANFGSKKSKATFTNSKMSLTMASIKNDLVSHTNFRNTIQAQGEQKQKFPKVEQSDDFMNKTQKNFASGNIFPEQMTPEKNVDHLNHTFSNFKSNQSSKKQMHWGTLSGRQVGKKQMNNDYDIQFVAGIQSRKSSIKQPIYRNDCIGQPIYNEEYSLPNANLNEDDPLEEFTQMDKYGDPIREESFKIVAMSKFATSAERSQPQILMPFSNGEDQVQDQNLSHGFHSQRNRENSLETSNTISNYEKQFSRNLFNHLRSKTVIYSPIGQNLIIQNSKMKFTNLNSIASGQLKMKKGQKFKKISDQFQKEFQPILKGKRAQTIPRQRILFDQSISEEGDTRSTVNLPKYPPVFRLKDLHEYSKTLRAPELSKLQRFQPLLGQKYKKDKEFFADNYHDWAKTPFYKKKILNMAKTRSIDGTDLLNFFVKSIRVKKLNIKGKRSHKVTDAERNFVNIPLSKLLVRAVEKAYSKILDENQIQYYTNVFKKYGRLEEFEKTERHENFNKAKNTLQILLTDMGLDDIFMKIVDHYDNELHFRFEETFIKILYRCLIGYRSLDKLQTIFSMIDKKDQYLRDFVQASDSSEEELTAKSEDLLTQFVLQSSKLCIQINQFNDESNYFKFSPFVVNKINIQEQLIKDIQWIKENYQNKFEYSIPIMQPNGKLVF